MLALIVAPAMTAGAASQPNGTRPDGMRTRDVGFKIGTQVSSGRTAASWPTSMRKLVNSTRTKSG
jgi:hypothetical protein